MPNYYIGAGGDNPIGAMFRPTSGTPTATPRPPIRPVQEAPPAAASAPTSVPASILPAQAVRPSGPSGGYDPSYLQNLATAIGGLFSRPQGNLTFNPLGNLSEISPSSGMDGNSPLPGLPSTWLQDALNGLGFNFGGSPATTGTAVDNGRAVSGGRGPRSPVLQ